MAIVLAAMILATAAGDLGALDWPRPDAAAASRAAGAAPTVVAAPGPIDRGRAGEAAAREAGPGASGSPAKAVTLAVATTLFGAWALARSVARWVA